jgi:hypothetical protein
VDEENTTALEANNQVLAAAIDTTHPLADELGRHDDRIVRPYEPGVEDLCVLDTRALEHGRDVSPDGLDLGSLGHGPSVAARRARHRPLATTTPGATSSVATRRFLAVVR